MESKQNLNDVKGVGGERDGRKMWSIFCILQTELGFARYFSLNYLQKRNFLAHFHCHNKGQT